MVIMKIVEKGDEKSMGKNNNYWQEDFILQFSMQIQEAIKEQRDNNKRDYTVSNNKGGGILWLK